MVTLPQNKGLVSFLVVISLIWSGLYLFNWLVQNIVARELFVSTLIFIAAAVLIGREVYTRLTSWNEDRQTRPARNAKS